MVRSFLPDFIKITTFDKYMRVALEACHALHSATRRRHFHDYEWRATRRRGLYPRKRPESISAVVRPFPTFWLAYLDTQQHGHPTDVSL